MTAKKKKPTKKKDSVEAEIRTACEEIVASLYVEVEKVHGDRLDLLQKRIDELTAAHDVTVSECGLIIDRLVAVEDMGNCPRRRHWLRRLFCFPWCRR